MLALSAAMLCGMIFSALTLAEKSQVERYFDIDELNKAVGWLGRVNRPS